MENASKALIMAGSILLSLLVVGALVVMFQSLRDLKTQEASSDEVLKLTEYNKQIETFNRDGLYGSELMSLSNLVIDYNKRQSELKGYKPIELEINIKKEIPDSQYFKTMKYTQTSLAQIFEEVEEKIEKNKKQTILYTEKTAERINAMRDSELSVLIKEKKGWKLYSSSTQEEIEDINNKVQVEIEKIRQEAEIYTNLKSDLTTFKNKQFAQPTVKYDDKTGRVIKMVFTER